MTNHLMSAHHARYAARIHKISLILLGWLLCCAGVGSTPSIAEAAPSKARRWRVMVIIPEQHLERPRIPDPAVETAVTRQLIDAGYKVIDQERIKELRYSGVIDRILKGGAGALKELTLLKRRFGADVLVTGEAFTQEVSRQSVDTDMGTVLQIRCRARIELKALRMDTAEVIYADSIQQTGPPEPTVELSSKACLEQAADEMSPSLLKKLDKLAFSGTRQIELEVRGIASLSLANQLEKLLQTITGVREVLPGDYEARVYSTEVLLDETAILTFAARLETDPKLRRFKLKVQSSSGSRIVANCR